VGVYGKYKVDKVTKVLDFFNGDFFCDRFEFVYPKPLGNNWAHARCRVSPMITTGHHPASYRV